MSQPPAPPSPPPPAYSEQEFDAKVATALQASLHISQAKKPVREEEEWEEWDEAAFEAAARAASGQERPASPSASSSSGSASSRALPPPPASHRNSASPPVIRPLNIHKKNRSSSSSNSGSVTSLSASTSSQPPEKPRPSWYDEAGLGEPAASPSTGPSGFVIQNTTENDQDYSVPPPPFSATGPSLDGPPFEEVDTSSHRTPQPRPVMTMRPPSVAPVPQQTLQYDRPHHVRTITPPPPPPPLSLSPSHARMSFNPSVAYGKTRNPYPEAQPIQSMDAAAFYNSSVASHLASATPQRPQPMSPQRPPSMIGQSQQPSYKRATYMSPVAPVPTYPNAAMRPRMPSGADLSNYTPSYADPNAYHGAQNARWATSEQQLSNFFH